VRIGLTILRISVLGCLMVALCVLVSSEELSMCVNCVGACVAQAHYVTGAGITSNV
jgi:hypothetical protein